MTEYLFVYGWLKQKYHRDLPFEMPKKKIGDGFVYGKLFYVADYPGLELGGSQLVFGELYEIPTQYDWSEMDHFEQSLPTIVDNPEYERVRATCYLSKEPYNCWVYQYLRDWDQNRLIAGGEF